VTPNSVVLREEDYSRLLAAQAPPIPGLGALQWLLAQSPAGSRSREEIDNALATEREW